jgi:hypothetical protein
MRMPWEVTDGEESQVRRTITSVMRDHLSPLAAVSWSRLRFDFTAAVLSDCDFSAAEFRACPRFERATFIGQCSFGGVTFRQGAVFRGAQLTAGLLNFHGIYVKGERVDMAGMVVNDGTVRFFPLSIKVAAGIDLGKSVFTNGRLSISVLPSYSPSGYVRLSGVRLREGSSATFAQPDDFRVGRSEHFPCIEASAWVLEGKSQVCINRQLYKHRVLLWEPASVEDGADVTLTGPLEETKVGAGTPSSSPA